MSSTADLRVIEADSVAYVAVNDVAAMLLDLAADLATVTDPPGSEQVCRTIAAGLASYSNGPNRQ